MYINVHIHISIVYSCFPKGCKYDTKALSSTFHE